MRGRDFGGSSPALYMRGGVVAWAVPEEMFASRFFEKCHAASTSGFQSNLDQWTFKRSLHKGHAR
jgi:hypothetical protein